MYTNQTRRKKRITISKRTLGRRIKQCLNKYNSHCGIGNIISVDERNNVELPVNAIEVPGYEINKDGELSVYGIEMPVHATIDIYDENHMTTETNTSKKLMLTNHLNSTINGKCHLVNINTTNLQEDLRYWCLQFNITNVALTSLLRVLNTNNIPNIPTDGRTLLKTPTTIKIVEVHPGLYWHNSLESTLQNIYGINNFSFREVYINFHIDGLPISNSSKACFWPILATIENIKIKAFPVGIYYGNEKPSSCAEYLKFFVDELNSLVQNGFKTYNDVTIQVKIRSFIMDAPAKAYVKRTIGHNGYFGCGKCTVEGYYDREKHHMSYTDSHCSIRNDSSFRNKDQYEHHLELTQSPLESLPIDMIKCFPGDYMHLVCLGVMKRMLKFWIEGNVYEVKLPYRDIKKLSTLLKQAAETQPNDFARKIRSVDVIKFWKATELRTFLLYTGPVVLKEILAPAVYKNFIALHCAISIYSSEMHIKYHNIAKQLLLYFVDSYKIIYGFDSISYNVHNLIHMSDDVEEFGLIDSFSAFPFESQLYCIKNLLHSGNKPLQQVAKRIVERISIHDFIIEKREDILYPNACRKISDIHEISEGDGTYNEIKFENFSLNVTDRNKWFLTKTNDIVEYHSATFIANELIIYGSNLITKTHVYDTPINSSNLLIFKSSGSLNTPNIWKLPNLKCKMFCLDIENYKYYFPILHSIK